MSHSCPQFPPVTFMTCWKRERIKLIEAYTTNCKIGIYELGNIDMLPNLELSVMRKLQATLNRRDRIKDVLPVSNLTQSILRSRLYNPRF